MLIRCVRSVLDQTRRPDEVIIIDDASEASYEEALRRLRSESGRVPLVYRRLVQTQRASHARNVGASLANGNVLMFVDDDDTWTPCKVENQVELFAKHSDIGLAYAGRNAVDHDGNLLYRIAPTVSGFVHRAMLQRNHIGTTSGVALRAELFAEVGGFDEKLPAVQDYDLWLRITKLAPVAYDAAFTVNWTVHAAPRQQMTGNPHLYEQAFGRLDRKYAPDFEKLSTLEQRKARASRYTIISDKYARVGSVLQYVYAMRSLLQFPSLAALSRFLPYRVWRQLRALYQGDRFASVFFAG